MQSRNSIDNTNSNIPPLEYEAVAAAIRFGFGFATLIRKHAFETYKKIPDGKFAPIGKSPIDKNRLGRIEG